MFDKVGGEAMELVLLFLLGFGAVVFPKYLKFRRSGYRAATGNTFWKTLWDKGSYGEFLTFNYLEKLDGSKRIMANIYLPKKDGMTTEIDLLMITETGMYVFDSKNYSGWIFGNEKSKNWMQTLPNKQKFPFYNPIWQNKGHINALKSVLQLENDDLFISYIIFSERCTLKKIEVTSDRVRVIKRGQLVKSIKQEMYSATKVLTPTQIEELYSMLKKYENADDVIKKLHVDQVKRKKG